MRWLSVVQAVGCGRRGRRDVRAGLESAGRRTGAHRRHSATERQARSQRFVAGGQLRELGHPGAHREGGARDAARSGRAGAREGSARVRRGRFGAERRRRRRRRRAALHRRRPEEETGEPGRTGCRAIRRSSAISPACRARPTCRSRFRSSRATPRCSWPTNTPARCVTSI